jgi:predicted methyltransferase
MIKILEETANAASLREGIEGVRSILAAVVLAENIPLKQLAQAVHMPLPVVAAVRRELEKRGILARDKGVCLTEKGEALVAEFGIVSDQDFSCVECSGTGFVVPDSLQDVLELLQLVKRPEVNVQLDQAFALPETSLRRAVYALQAGALTGRNVVFMGDDDLISIAVALLLKKFSPAQSIVVLDIDERILGLIESLSAQHELNIECVSYDAREPLPQDLFGRFQTFFTDPPYTVNGLHLFLTRAAQALADGPGRQGFLSFGHKDPDSDLEVFRTIGECGFAPLEIIPGFNTYSGGGIIGNSSRMVRLTSGTGQLGAETGHFSEPIYTGEINVSYRHYDCTGCGHVHRVGIDYHHETIEALKKAGCAECGAATFKLMEKVVSTHQ